MACTAAVGVPHLTPHSTRHAGATIDVQSSSNVGQALAEVQLRGRWKAAKSVARYAKPHLVDFYNRDISETLLAKGRKFLRKLEI